MTPSPVRLVEERPTLDVRAFQDLRQRLQRSRLPPALSSSWDQGVAPDWLAHLLAEWRSFDVETLQRRLDALTHLRAEVDGQSLHLVHAPSPAATHAMPLILTHGWPSSFLEFLPVLDALRDPASAGNAEAPAFDVVVPSLPGFGFSGPPPATGLTPREIARAWHRVMTEGFGYPRYVAHGSDLGAGVTTWLARDYPDSVAAIHLATPGLRLPDAPRSSEERAFGSEVDAWAREEGGYAHEHSTKPATLAAALNDSPAGLAAWIGEKAVAWSSTRPDGEPAFDRFLLLSTLTLYWTTESIATSMLPYWLAQHRSGVGAPADDPSPVPTALSIFGGERVPFAKPPRSVAERFYRVTHWREHPTGGHFPSIAEPGLFVDTLRQVFAGRE